MNRYVRLVTFPVRRMQTRANSIEIPEEFDAKDHRRIGKDQSLFHFSPLSPGSPIFLPRGQRIIQTLKNYLRQKYRAFGFDEVSTPLLFDKQLWVTSGHWQNFKDDMFTLGYDQESEHTFGLKPMNCPAHCLIFKSESRSYRDLPLRIAEFAPLHRNEASGALTGLTRVRTFHQDDAHIFCRPDQIEAEIKNTLAFVDQVYTKFGFEDYQLFLSTRPIKYLGSIDEWNAAETALSKALNETGRKWKVKPEDGAFYGPKIDILVKDAQGREHQTATIQLDFQLPHRFNLQYQTEDGKAPPVIIHRAVLGSIERMMAILIEHYQGHWPFWLSPRQVVVIPVHPTDHLEYATSIATALKSQGYFCDVDTSDNTLGKKMAEALKSKYNVFMVVGDKEMPSKTISVRSRNVKKPLVLSLDETLAHLKQLE